MVIDGGIEGEDGDKAGRGKASIYKRGKNSHFLSIDWEFNENDLSLSGSITGAGVLTGNRACASCPRPSLLGFALQKPSLWDLELAHSIGSDLYFFQMLQMDKGVGKR